MSVFPTIHSERIAPGSFQQPAPILAALPGEPPFVTVCFNKAWLPYILGCLFQLMLNTTWQASSDDELNGALEQANQMILIFQKALDGCQTKNPAYAGSGGGDEFMLRQNPDNPCLLETSVNGTDWCVWADLSKCTGQPMQPGKGAEDPPSGGCSNSFGTVEFGSRWMLPQNVSTGDVITVTNAVGTWASALDLFIPRCPDGNIFFEVGCVSGTGHTEMTDPAPAINHDSLIAFDGTNYYDCGPASDGTPVVITIPGGITKANLFFFANTPDTSGFGAVNFDVQYCNNAVGSFSHVFDFTSSPGGWVALPLDTGLPVSGLWVAGSGWHSVDTFDAPYNNRAVAIERTFASREINAETVRFNYTPGTVDAGKTGGQVCYDLAGTPYFNNVPGSTVNGTGVAIAAVVDNGATTKVTLILRPDNTTGAVSGVALVTGVTLGGIGTDPF